MGSDAGLTLRIAEIPERLARSRPPGTLGGFVGGLCLTVGYVSLAFFVFLIATPSRNLLTYYWAALPSAGVVGVSFLIAGARPAPSRALSSPFRPDKLNRGHHSRDLGRPRQAVADRNT